MNKISLLSSLIVCAMVCVIASPAAAATLLGHWAMDEGTGTVLADSSGNGYDGTLISGTWTADRFGLAGKAILLNNQRIDIPDDAKAETVTLAAWINPTRYGSTSSPACIFSSETGSGASGFVWRLALIDNGILRMEAVAPYSNSSERYIKSATGAIPLNEWHHVAGTYDGTTVRIYIDGSPAGSKQYGSQALLNTSASIPSTIGYMSWGLQYFGGTLDDARIYDGVLTDAEIFSLGLGSTLEADIIVNDDQRCFGGRIVPVAVSGLTDISFRLEYSANDGTDWNALDSGVYTAGPVYWNVPQTIDSDDCLLRVTSQDGGYVYGESELFSVKPCSVTTDLTGDCYVNLADLLELAAEWLTGENG